MISTVAQDDGELVGLTLSGNRDAFGQIVSRYQSLICSLAYSATGSLAQSEDLAQETFITAWKHLGKLRERDKFRAWLCGIARNRINNFLRREGREPVRKAEPLDDVLEPHALEPLPVDYTISKEESELLWRALERIPEIYREPLVLFYREHQSIETVAANLDLTEDNVKQRLSRGRKLLQEQVLAFVEGALARTNPGKTFTFNVLAALPVAGTTAKFATLGAAAKGAGAKAAGASLFGAVLGPVMIFFGNYLGYRIGLAEARSEEERSYVKSFYRRVCAVGLSASVLFAAIFLWTAWNEFPRGELFEIVFTGIIIIYLLTIFISVVASSKQRHRYYAKILQEEHGGVFPESAFEYRSKTKFLGLPLVHVRIGARFDFLRKPVTAWIAFGNYSVGGLLAFGGVAVAPFSIGGLAVGIIPFGGLTVGAFALGGLALGIWAFGGIAVGWQSYGCVAIAWQMANGNFAFAYDFAKGNIAHAAQVNNDAVLQFRNSNLFFRIVQVVNRYWLWLNLLWITPLFMQWQIIARKNRRQCAQEN